MIFDQSTSSGKALKVIAEDMLQPLLNAGVKIAPFFEGFFEGLTYGLLLIDVKVLELSDSLGSMFPDSFLKNLDLAEVGFYAAAGVIGVVVTALVALAALIGLVGLALGLIALPFIAAGAAIYGVITLISEAFDALSQIDLYEVGANIVKGFVDGIKAGAAAVADAVTGLASSAMSAVKGALKIASPSKVFRAYGSFTAQGFAEGVDDGTPGVEEAVNQLAAPPAPAPSGGSAPIGAGGGTTIRIEAGAIVIQGVKDADEMEGGPFLQKLAKALASIASQAGGPALEPAR
jgi:hypothetical protein